MNRQRSRIVIGRDGSLRAADPGSERQVRMLTGEYEIIGGSPATLFLHRTKQCPEGAPRLLMAGEVISRMTMLEIVSVIANSNWRGELLVDGNDGSERVLSFDQGALKHCRSTQPDDLLGEVLFRAGVVDRDTLRRVLDMITPEKRFGELCLEEAIVTQEGLYNHLRRQAEQIFFGALLVADGFYTFRTIDDDAPPPDHTIHLPIQGLLMEGVQRIDEMALFRERIPHADLCPKRRETAPPKKLDDTAVQVLELADGKRSIDEIARLTGLGDFLTTKSVYHLLQQGTVELHASPNIDLQAIRRLVARFNEVMRDIFVAVATYGGVDNTRTTLAAWIQGSGYAPYFGEEVDIDGSISADTVVASVERIEAEHPLEALHQGLHELAAFALFSATTTLPRDQELILARDVNRRLKAIRI